MAQYSTYLAKRYCAQKEAPHRFRGQGKARPQLSAVWTSRCNGSNSVNPWAPRDKDSKIHRVHKEGSCEFPSAIPICIGDIETVSAATNHISDFYIWSLLVRNSCKHMLITKKYSDLTLTTGIFAILTSGTKDSPQSAYFWRPHLKMLDCALSEAPQNVRKGSFGV